MDILREQIQLWYRGSQTDAGLDASAGAGAAAAARAIMQEYRDRNGGRLIGVDELTDAVRSRLETERPSSPGVRVPGTSTYASWWLIVVVVVILWLVLRGRS